MNKAVKNITKLTGVLSLCVMLSSCLSGKDESETVFTDLGNALVTNFSLKDNSNVAKSLSSYKFTIDHYGTSDPGIHALSPNDGIIFNADSLPYGSIPDSVKVSISYSAPQKVEFYLYDKNGTLKQFSNYANDSALWFASNPDARLKIVSQDGTTTKTYRIKVNVHRVVTDTIVWKNLNETLWQGVDVKMQRTDTLNGMLKWYVQEQGGRIQMIEKPLIGNDEWSLPVAVEALDGESVDLETLYGNNGALFAVNRKDNTIWWSQDGLNWSERSNACKFVNILGALPAVSGANIDEYYWRPETLVALVDVEGGYRIRYSEDKGKTWIVRGSDKVVDADFPVSGFARPISTQAKASMGNVASRITLVGGRDRNGKLLNTVWCCDGTAWANIANTGTSVPAMAGASIMRYTLDSDYPHTFWILWPGEMEGGKVSNDLYCSEDNGLSWHKMKTWYGRKAYGDTQKLEPVACNSAFYDPKSYQMYLFGGKREDGTWSTTIFGGVYSNLDFQKLR